jgi:cytochrome c oxidase cbb3-type subunit 3
VTHSLLPAFLAIVAAAAPATVAVYKTKCQSCHTASGAAPLEPMNLADGMWKHGSQPADIARVITEGVPGTAMKPFKKQLTPQQIARLAAYVHSFDKTRQAAPTR